MPYPKISIITPSFNQGKFIEETICSVLDQSYPNLEYIIMDGGSTDETISVIKKYEKHLTYWESGKDKGQSDAINKGLKRATGEIVNWLNSDDYYAPGALHHIGAVFSNPAVYMYCGISRIFSSETIGFSKGSDVYADNLCKTIGQARIDQPETFMRKAGVEGVGYLNSSLNYVMDRDLWVRLLCRYGLNGVVKDDMLIAHFRLHDSSKTVAHQPAFSTEHNNLFYTYAQAIANTRYRHIFETLFAPEKIKLERIPDSLVSDKWDCVFNYYLLGNGLERYAQNDYAGAKKVLKHVDKYQLAEPDAIMLSRVLLRIRYLPVVLKKVWNKLQ